MILTIPPSQRDAFYAGEPVTVWVAFEEQPPEDYSCSQLGSVFCHPCVTYCTCDAGERQPTLLPSPLGPVGTRHGVGEEWGIFGPMAGSRVFYKADRYEPPLLDKNLGGWRSADTLPDWAVRTHATVTDAGTVTQREGVWGVEGMVVKC